LIYLSAVLFVILAPEILAKTFDVTDLRPLNVSPDSYRHSRILLIKTVAIIVR
jgi:hypothetical protein